MHALLRDDALRTSRPLEGAVFTDRYHARPLPTPRAVHFVQRYVLLNARKHGCRTARLRRRMLFGAAVRGFRARSGLGVRRDPARGAFTVREPSYRRRWARRGPGCFASAIEGSHSSISTANRRADAHAAGQAVRSTHADTRPRAQAGGSHPDRPSLEHHSRRCAPIRGLAHRCGPLAPDARHWRPAAHHGRITLEARTSMRAPRLPAVSPLLSRAQLLSARARPALTRSPRPAKPRSRITPWRWAVLCPDLPDIVARV